MVQQNGEQQIIVIENAWSFIARLEKQSAQHQSDEQIYTDPVNIKYKMQYTAYICMKSFLLTANKSASYHVFLSDNRVSAECSVDLAH